MLAPLRCWSEWGLRQVYESPGIQPQDDRAPTHLLTWSSLYARGPEEQGTVSLGVLGWYLPGG